MSADTVAERYAQAIFELAVESGDPGALIDEIRTLAEVFGESGELRKIMGNPLVPDHDLGAAVGEIADRLGLSRLAKNAAGLLTRRKRMFALPAIVAELGRLSDERAGLARASVISAEPLSEAFADRLTEELRAMTGKQIVLEQQHDPDLLAGLIVRIGDQVIDGSARTRLAELSSHLLLA